MIDNPIKKEYNNPQKITKFQDGTEVSSVDYTLTIDNKTQTINETVIFFKNPDSSEVVGTYADHQKAVWYVQNEHYPNNEQ